MKNMHDVIVRPIITEDSMARLADKKYTFGSLRQAQIRSKLKRPLRRFSR